MAKIKETIEGELVPGAPAGSVAVKITDALPGESLEDTIARIQQTLGVDERKARFMLAVASGQLPDGDILLDNREPV